MNDTYKGSCFCGAVMFEVTGAPEAKGYCHCGDCASWAAAPVNAFSLWSPDSLRITKGEDSIGTYNKTERSYRKFCKTCGGHLFTDHPTMNVVDVYTSVLPDLRHEPTAHVFYAEGTVAMRDGLPKFKDMPDRHQFGHSAIAGNRTAGDLSRARESLEDGRRQLERRVDERTRKLKHELAEHESAEAALRKSEESLIVQAEELRMARAQARTANRAKSEFLANMSHELRTPLNAINGFSEMIMAETLGPVGNATYREYAGDINDSGHHLLSLINEILDMSKIESGMEELDEEDIRVHDLMTSVITFVKERARNGGIKLEMDPARGLPLVRADERKMKQILINLLSNAIKFTEAAEKSRSRHGAGRPAAMYSRSSIPALASRLTTFQGRSLGSARSPPASIGGTKEPASVCP